MQDIPAESPGTLCAVTAESLSGKRLTRELSHLGRRRQIRRDFGPDALLQ
jgi:hypothetical protein